MFHSASILLCNLLIYTGSYELFREEQMPLIDLFGNLLTRIGQKKMAIPVNEKEALALQLLHCITNTWF